MSYEDFFERCKTAASDFLATDKNETIRIISHLDSDGMSAAAIAAEAMIGLRRNFRLSIKSGLDSAAIEELSKERYNIYFFTDLGSGQIDIINKHMHDKKVFILDHHKPNADALDIIHVNPMLFGIDGGTEISGSGVSYYFFKNVDPSIKEHAHLAIIGAIGDMQENNGFRELNDRILKESRIESKNTDGTYEYLIPFEEENSLRNLRRFSTVLNSCGRLDRMGVGIGACLGDPEMKKKAVACLMDYKSELLKAMEWFKDNRGNALVIENKGYVIINAKDKIMPTIIGTVASMISKSGEFADGTYVMSLSRMLDGNTKVSFRICGSRECDLRETAKEIIGKLKAGEFGGHKNAAGALFPTEMESEFLEIAKQVLGKIGIEEEIK